MLSPREKQRIRAEEAFRKRLQSDKSVRVRGLWSTLNSPLIIWVLSTIVIGVFSWLYTQEQKHHENEVQIDKLDIEIVGRFGTTIWRIESNLTSDTKFDAAKLLLQSPTADNAIQPEYSSRNLKSLLYELNGRVPASERPDTMKALTEIMAIEAYSLNKQMNAEELHEFAKKILELQDSRWKYNKLWSKGSDLYDERLAQILWTAGVLIVLGLAGFWFYVYRLNKRQIGFR